jgi:MerR family transcriptional regulator, heat shock protein HspR
MPPDRAAPPARSPAVRYPDESEPHFTVGQAAELVGVQPAFLRRLEAFEAVSPARTPGGQRRYSRQDLEHIAALNALMGEGLTLAGALRIVELQAEVDELRRQLGASQVRSNDRRRPSTRP